MIDIVNCTFRIQDKFLLKDINCSIAPNELIVIMGANGAGKSTLLKLIAGVISASSGELFIENQLIKKYSAQQLALKRAVLSQHYEIAFPLSVKEIILMGRYPYFRNHPSTRDLAIVNEVMAEMGIENLADRIYQTLSGGEAQKVHMCRVLAQINGEDKKNKFLLLDEPVSHLDIKYQYHLLEISKRMVNPNTAIIAVLHDINLALKFADRILFMKEGRIVHEHQKKDPLAISVIKQVFDVEASIINMPNENRQWVCF
jgi:iron complex transport system ATP-binding protein